MKAIKGLEDRLYALDQMIASCSRLVNEQKELAQVMYTYVCVRHWKMLTFDICMVIKIIMKQLQIVVQDFHYS